LACHLQIDANPDPDPAFYFDAEPDPDPSHHFGADPDPTFLFDADPCGSGSAALVANITNDKKPNKCNYARDRRCHRYYLFLRPP
jgi:hypothetical protein